MVTSVFPLWTKAFTVFGAIVFGYTIFAYSENQVWNTISSLAVVVWYTSNYIKGRRILKSINKK
ncbi:hypothetical protein [Flavobacterium enshiense]|nr:hypothetical protein [Flavobacterium enshiense]